MNENADRYDMFVLFVGLIAWVPLEKRVGGRRKEVGAAAVLPKVVKDDATYGYETAGGHALETHDSTLVVAARCEGAACDETARFLDAGEKETGVELGTEGRTREWRLDRECVSFKFPSATEEKFECIRGQKSPRDRWPEKTDKRDTRMDFDWVPSMDEVCLSNSQAQERLQGAQIIDQTVLMGDTRSTHFRVAARVRLDRGTLTTAGMVTVDGGEMPAYEFDTMGTNHLRPAVNQALAEYVLLHVQVEDPEDEGVKLMRSRFGGEPASLTLRPVSLDGRPLIFVVVSNQPPPIANYKRPRNAPAGHFEVFYDLSARPVARAFRPVPHPHSDLGPTGSSLVGMLLETLRGEREEREDLGPLLKQLEDLIRRFAGEDRPICPQGQFQPV